MISQFHIYSPLVSYQMCSFCKSKQDSNCQYRGYTALGKQTLILLSFKVTKVLE